MFFNSYLGETVKELMEVESSLPQKVCLHTFYIKNINLLYIFGGSKLSTSENYGFLHSLGETVRTREDVFYLSRSPTSRLGTFFSIDSKCSALPLSAFSCR